MRSEDMSANNLIFIREIKRDKKYEISMRDADTGYILGDVLSEKSLRKAINTANKIQTKEIVEYGVTIELKP